MSSESNKSRLIGQFVKYLYVVVYHAKCDYIRQNNRYKRNILEQIDDSRLYVSFEETLETVLPESRDFDFSDEVIQSSLMSISDRLLQILRYTFIHRLSNAEIAKLLGISPASVAPLRSRALRRLRELIERGEIIP
jgi:RNA polymerase sigma factor, sigma-70 family